MLSSGQLHRMHHRRPTIQDTDRFLGVWQFFGELGAFHGEEFAAFFDEGEAPFDEDVHGADGAGGDDVEGFAQVAVGDVLGAVGEDADVGQGEGGGGSVEESGFFLGGFEEENLGVGAGDGQGDAGDAAAAADVGEAMGILRKVREERQGVGDVEDLGGGAVFDPRQVHRLVGLEEEVEVAMEEGMLRLAEAQTRGGGKLGPECIHGNTMRRVRFSARRGIPRALKRTLRPRSHSPGMWLMTPSKGLEAVA